MIKEVIHKGLDLFFCGVLLVELGTHPSWASSKHLGDRHTQRGINCELCHGSLPPKELVSMEQCLRCHGSYQQVAALTQKLSPNPHDSHYGKMRCTLCHKVHKDSVLYCNTCHSFEFKVP